jgi:hypothetical protein
MNAHIIDINILLQVNAKAWIVNKDDPNKPLIKFDITDFNLFKSGIFRTQNNKIQFNGKTFWLSNEFMNKVKIVAKKSKVDISNLGISMQEFMNPEIIENLEFDLDLSIFNNIVNTNDDIYIICSKNTKSRYTKQIEKLEDKLESLGLKIKNYYFISTTFTKSLDDKKAVIKSKIILQHLLGIKVESEKFVEETITDYNQITFYDDDQLSIQTAININSVLEKYLLLTDDTVKTTIKEKIKKDDNFLIIKEYTHNRSKKFNEYNVQLELTNVIKSFENWRWKSD